MAILRGFPPSNTISPTTWVLKEPEKPDVGAKNHWVRTYKLKKEKAVQFTVKSRLIVPDAKLLAEMVAASKAADEERGRHQGVKRAE